MATLPVSKERPVHTYAELWHASWCVFDKGQQNKEGSNWQFLSSLLLNAFALEAYLNHIGPSHIKDWNKLERKPVRKKLLRLSEILGVKHGTKDNERPLLTITQLFEFRNSLAHGRSTVLTEKIEHEAPDGFKSVHELFNAQPKTDWESLIQDSTFSELARTDVEIVIRVLHATRGETSDILFNSGIGHGSATLQNVP